MPSSTILLVDDEPNVTLALKRALRQEEYHILTADSPDTALAALAAHRVDVVISDERMPGGSGAALMSKIRVQYPDTIRIMLSGQADLNDVVRAINEGEIYRFFIKPFNAVDLRTTIQQALQHKLLVQQSRRLLREYQKQREQAEDRTSELDGALMHVETDDNGAILVEEDDGDIGQLLVEIDREMNRARERGGSGAESAMSRAK